MKQNELNEHFNNTEIIVHPIGSGPLHATLLQRVARNTISRFWLTHDTPLFFHCKMLDTILLTKYVIITILKTGSTDTLLGLIERAGRKTYVFCRFGGHVTSMEMKKLGIEIQDEMKDDLFEMMNQTKNKKLNEPLLEMALINDEIIDCKSPSKLQIQTTDELEVGSLNSNIDQIEKTMISVKNLLEQLKKQYFEILYTSKVSLAYFTKTTLMKTRTHCQACIQARLEMIRFIQFSLLKTPVQLETKFKKWLPILLSIWLKQPIDQCKWPPEMQDWCIETDEKTFIMHWCNLNEKELPLLYENNTNKIDALKIRECEVLSLRREIDNIDKNWSEKQLKNQLEDQPVDIEQYLDLLIDRLCIWQALNDTHLLDSGTFDSKSDNDQLRQFCAEVVIPFYASKLPDVCNALSIKCGGPSLSYHTLRSKRFKKKKVMSSVKEESMTIATKPSMAIVSCLATALIDEKTKSFPISTTSRSIIIDKYSKGISRDGILNSKRSLQHREIKMPLLKPISKRGFDKTDDNPLSRCTEEIRRVRMKQNVAKVEVQVLETPQKGQSISKNNDSINWEDEKIICTPMINNEISELSIEKCHKIEYVLETPKKIMKYE
ncbi:hypothetical protein PCANB_000324 [Pneumocystis canis]|nr:hypothetical protein PCANB_000324 [Pneumocystis canis]